MKFATALIKWFEQSKRDLPWRKTNDPYRIWISEVMLQQTQVATVIPYYHRFLEKFPDVRSLASAPQGDLMKAWEGLGYYARARNLQHAAKEIVSKYGGTLPRTQEALRTLKGFGPYTSASVASIAFGADAAAVDGNVIRVIARLRAIKEDVRLQPTKDAVQQIAGELLPHGKAGAFNEAMMELGATVCTPKRPNCDGCPVSEHCIAYQTNQVEKFPVKSKLAVAPHYHIAVGVVWREDHVLIALRQAEGLLGNLWEFPGGKVKAGETLATCCRREVEEETGLKVMVQAEFIAVKHAYTHFKITLHAFRCEYVSGEAAPKQSQEIRWVKPDELLHFAFPKANRRVIDAILNPSSQVIHPATLSLFETEQ
ncbi:MAG: A/G-specific adenine glycosylase [Rhizobacter sp.]|nr:A/G-specific adenine glycosylase [Chlorobiales bacterium]